VNDKQDSPGVKVFPPGIYAVALIVGVVISRRLPALNLPHRLETIAGGALIAAWLVLMLAAIRVMRRENASIRPDRPSQALVVTGPFRFTRNPLYLGLVFVYCGLAILLNALWALLLLPAVIVIMRRWVIDREEAYLERAFGAEYRDYKARVRRWI
jgi:protein-S-isoprenylcysteine O-methyltransferase Ste14